MNNYSPLLNSVMTAAWDDASVSKAMERAASFDPAVDAINVRAAVSLIASGFVVRSCDMLGAHSLILICPQMIVIIDLGAAGGQREKPHFQQLIWAGISYLPSTVFPTGLSAEGLPIGLQAVSAPFRDYRCIEFARLITEEMGGFDGANTLNLELTH